MGGDGGSGGGGGWIAVKMCGWCGAAVFGGREEWALKVDCHFCDLPESSLEILYSVCVPANESVDSFPIRTSSVCWESSPSIPLTELWECKFGSGPKNTSNYSAKVFG